MIRASLASGAVVVLTERYFFRMGFIIREGWEPVRNAEKEMRAISAGASSLLWYRDEAGNLINPAHIEMVRNLDEP